MATHALTRTPRDLYHVINGGVIAGANSDLRGDCSELRGDCSGLWGNCSGLWGDCSGLSGDLNDIPYDARPCNLADWVQE